MSALHVRVMCLSLLLPGVNGTLRPVNPLARPHRLIRNGSDCQPGLLTVNVTGNVTGNVETNVEARVTTCVC